MLAVAALNFLRIVSEPWQISSRNVSHYKLILFSTFAFDLPADPTLLPGPGFDSTSLQSARSRAAKK